MAESLRRAAAAIEHVRNGGMAILAWEDECGLRGDLCLAAQEITADAINFMCTHACGLVCLALDEARFKQLGLSLMVIPDYTKSRTMPMGISIEARSGVTTGISAFDRAETIRTAMREDASSDLLRRPGHVVPLLALSDEVLVRHGLRYDRTEAAVDLSRLAGWRPGAVMCQILDDEGAVARRTELERFAEVHGARIVEVPDLIRFRLVSERAVRMVATATLPTIHDPELRAILYDSKIDGLTHLAFVKGAQPLPEPTFVHLHVECITGDVFGSLRCDCRSRLNESLRRLAESESGVLLYLRRDSREGTLLQKFRAYEIEDAQQDHGAEIRPDQRDCVIGAQMLIDLGIRRIRLRTNDPVTARNIESFGVFVESD